jgi:hypothetical protein
VTQLPYRRGPQTSASEEAGHDCRVQRTSPDCRRRGLPAGRSYVMQGGRRYVVPEGCKRLLAFVALQGGRADRRHAAGSLWPDGSEDRASGNLRSALWRLRCAGIDVLESDKVSIYLRRGPPPTWRRCVNGRTG